MAYPKVKEDFFEKTPSQVVGEDFFSDEPVKKKVGTTALVGGSIGGEVGDSKTQSKKSTDYAPYVFENKTVSDNIMSGSMQQQQSIKKDIAADNTKYINEERPKEIEVKAKEIKEQHVSTEPAFDGVDFLKKDIIEFGGGKSLSEMPSNLESLNLYFGNDANNAADYFKQRTADIDNEINDLYTSKQQLLKPSTGDISTGVDKPQINPLTGKPFDNATPEEKATDERINELRSYKNKLIQAQSTLAKKYAGWLAKDADVTTKGKVYDRIMGDEYAAEQQRLEDKGIPLTQEQKYNTDIKGLEVSVQELNDEYEGKPKDDTYYERLAHLNMMEKGILNKYPEFKRQQGGKLIAQLAMKDEKLRMAAQTGSGELDKELKQYLNKTYGIDEKDLKGLDYGDIPSESMWGNVAKGVTDAATGIATGITRIGGTVLGVDEDRLTHINEGIGSLGSRVFGDNPYAKLQESETLVNQDLKTIANPNAGKYNYNTETIKNAVGSGIGSLLGFIGGTKGVGKVLSLSDDAAMTSYLIGSGFEHNYQRANEVMGKDASEVSKGLYATGMGYLEALAFKVLPKDKIFFGSAETKSAQKELAKTLSGVTLETINRDALESGFRKVLKAAAGTTEETAKIGGAMSIAEMAKTAAAVLLGEDKDAAKFYGEWVSNVEHLVRDLPFSMGIPLGLMEIPKYRQHSNRTKQILFDAGSNPDTHIATIKQAQEKGLITPEQAEKKIEVVETMQNIVKSLPDKNPQTGTPLTQKQQAEYAYNRVKEIAVKTKSDEIKDAALTPFYKKEAQELVDERTAIVTGEHEAYKETVALADRIKETGKQKLYTDVGTKTEVVKTLSEQALSTPVSTKRALEDAELTSDLIARNEPQAIKAELKKLKDEHKKLIENEKKAEANEVEKGIVLLEAGLEKQKKPVVESEKTEVIETDTQEIEKIRNKINEQKQTTLPVSGEGDGGKGKDVVVDEKTKQQLLDERLNKIKEIKEKAEGTKDERTKRYQELLKESGDETIALKKLQEEINKKAQIEIDKLPELPKTENDIINQKGENDFEKIKKDLGFKENDYQWGEGTPMDETMGDMLLSKDKESVIFIKPHEVEKYDEKNDTTDTVTDGITIELVSTKESSRGQGKAKELIQKVTDWADKNKTDLHLDIAPQDKKTTEAGLKKLYESFGFEFKGIHGIRKPKEQSLSTKPAISQSSWQSNIEALVHPETGIGVVVKKILDEQQPLKDAFLKRIGLTIEDYRKLDEAGKEKIQQQWIKSKEFEELQNTKPEIANEKEVTEDANSPTKESSEQKVVSEVTQPTGGKKEPPKEPTETVGEEGKKDGITHAAVAELRKIVELPEYEGKPKETHEQLIAEAQETIKNNTDAAMKVIQKMENNGDITNKDNAIAAVYKATIDAALEKTPTKKLLDEARRLAKALDVSGTKLGKGLESRKLIAPEDNLANFLFNKEASQGTALSEKQIETESAKYNELKAAKEALEVELQKERESHARDIAEMGLNKAKAKAKREAKKSDEDYKAERKASVEAARKALKYIRDNPQSSTAPVFRELVAITPHVKDFVKSLVNEGVDKLDNIITAVHAEFKDVLEGLSNRDVLDIIAGEYNEKPKEQTKNEKANTIRLLEREAKLLKDLERERLNEEKAKNESEKTQSNRRIDELKEKIKEVRRLNKNRELDNESPEDATAGEIEYNAKLQKSLIEKAKKLTQDIKDKKYLEEEKAAPIFKKSRKTQLLEDKVIDLENKIRHERSKDEYNKRSGWRKAFDKIMEVLGIRRLVQSAVDISVPLRQGATLLSPRKIDIWAKGFKANLQSVFNPKKFERIMHEIRNDKQYHEMSKDGIVFNDLGSADPNLHNEDFRKSFVYKIPILSEPLKASNRSADAFLNVARYEMYKKMRRVLEQKGLTRESDPKAFQHMANFTMSMTGRGRMNRIFEGENMSTVLGNTFYGARLMASRFNLLNPVTYLDPRVPREAKLEAMKDMAAWTVTMMVAGVALSYGTGAKVSLNPDDSDFLQLRYGDKVYDISGGLANYVRTFLRITKAIYSRANDPKYQSKKSIEKGTKSFFQFFRNKLSPNTAYFLDMAVGKSYGDDFDPYEIAQIYPMYTEDVIKSWEEEGGLMSLSTVLLPNILGIGFGSYASKGQIDKNLEDLLQRNMRSDEMNSEKIHNYKDGGRAITFKEFNDFADKRDEKIEKDIKVLFEKGIGDIPYKDLTTEQVIDETNFIKANATRETKEEMFGKPKKKTSTERKEDKKELKERKEKYKNN